LQQHHRCIDGDANETNNREKCQGEYQQRIAFFARKDMVDEIE
jgi:hypothetical protein